MDNLLAKFGGNDPWEFNYEVEREIMLEMIRKIPKNTQSQSAVEKLVEGSDDGLSEEEALADEEEEDRISGDDDVSRSTSSSKQVRFSSGLPPSRQSRFGPEEDEEASSMYSMPPHTDQTVLRRGSATTSGFRRRQVSRLMSLQETPQGRLPMKAMNGSVPVSRHSLDKTKVVGGVVLR